MFKYHKKFVVVFHFHRIACMHFKAIPISTLKMPWKMRIFLLCHACLFISIFQFLPILQNPQKHISNIFGLDRAELKWYLFTYAVFYGTHDKKNFTFLKNFCRSLSPRMLKQRTNIIVIRIYEIFYVKFVFDFSTSSQLKENKNQLKIFLSHCTFKVLRFINSY